MSTLTDPILIKTLEKDREYLETTELPIFTVSGTYREDLKGLHHLPEEDKSQDIVFSRAHYSMALGVAVEAWQRKINPQKAWVVDPTNYVSSQEWSSIRLTDTIGKTLARYPLLKKLKDLVDQFGRQKLPILKSITPPLVYLSEDIEKPILSMHIASGNILALHGKLVVQVITDPHVREDYLANAELDNMYFCVFDQKTKEEFLEKAKLLNKLVNPKRVIVTGPPIDPRIIACRKHKKPWTQARPLKLCLTTGGLGTNKDEIGVILDQLLPTLRRRSPVQLMVYAGTHADIAEMVKQKAKENHVRVHNLSADDPADFEINAPLTRSAKKSDHSATLTLLYHPQIVDANELLIRHAFPWADGFISKPSGDMAYDAAAAGCFLLTLKEWGEWEYNIRAIFERRNIARRTDLSNIALQLEGLMASQGVTESWIEQAMKAAQKIDPLFIEGSHHIIEVQKRLR